MRRRTHMRDELRRFVIDAIRQMNYDVSEVTDETELGPAGLDLESLALAELAVQLEDHYRLKFSDDDMETLALMSLGEFSTVLSERIEAARATAPPTPRGAVPAADSTA
jgi:acyl carrier protein